MFNRRDQFLALMLIAGTTGGALQNCFGYDPPSLLAVFKKKGQVNSSLELKAENGPWLILAKTISGDDAQQKAETLAKELQGITRRRCYVLEKNFDHSTMLAAHSRKTERLDGTIETRRIRLANNEKEHVFAVLVGDFASLDDPTINETLNAIRTAQPPSLMDNSNPNKDPAKADSSNWMVDASRRMIWSRTERESNQSKGPMGAAFVTRNPLLPEEFFQAAKLDDFVINLNKNLDHSLLKCNKRFTVRVATFTGKAATIDSKLDMSDKSITDALDDAADKANRLTMALREKGVEAYQFHDRYGSYVTIGSFDEPEIAGPNGQRQLRPEIQEILKEYTGFTQINAKYQKSKAATSIPSLKTFADIPLDAEGKVMAVPKPATSKLYGGSLLGRTRN